MGFNINDYVPVHERIAEFYETYHEGRITTEILEHDEEKGFILIKATVFRGILQSDLPAATGHAFEIRGSSNVNKTSHIENCETSAVGRALALLGLKVKGGVASREEMEKVERMGGEENDEVRPNGGVVDSVKKTIASQKSAIINMCGQRKLGLEDFLESLGYDFDTLTVDQGKYAIQELQKIK